MTDILDNIYQSPAYVNILKAMNQVFGKDNWCVNCIWPSGNTNDFQMAMGIDGKARVAYVSVSDTHEKGMYSRGPGGGVSICVPLTTAWQFIFADNVTGDSVRHLEGTEEEQYRYRWGANGSNYPAIEGYVRILKRYLDKKESEVGE